MAIFDPGSLMAIRTARANDLRQAIRIFRKKRRVVAVWYTATWVAHRLGAVLGFLGVIALIAGPFALIPDRLWVPVQFGIALGWTYVVIYAVVKSRILDDWLKGRARRERYLRNEWASYSDLIQGAKAELSNRKKTGRSRERKLPR